LAAINKRKMLESAQRNLQKGAVDKALKDYQTLLDADPRDANVRLKVGDLKLRLGKTDEAIAAYLKVADQFTRDGFDAKAVAIYKQVSKLDSKRYDVYIPLADLYQRLGLSSEAMVALQTAAEAYQRDGRKREALDLLRRMASLDPTNTTSRLKVGELLLQEGLAPEALAEFTEAAAELERQGNWEARAGVLQRVLELAPDHLESYDTLINLWLERRQAKRAEGFARKLVELDPGRAESHELLARVLTDLGDGDGAIDSFRKAADAWIGHGMEDRARAILQRHIPSEPFDFGGTTDPLELGSMAAATRESESPFGEVGIGGEPMVTDDEFTPVGGDRLLADEPTSPAALPVVPAAKQPAPDVPPQPKPVAAEAKLARAATPAVSSAAATVVREQPTPTPVAAPAAPAASVASEGLEEGADLDQLLAEAGVYLRYGKRERAVASLDLLLAREPGHIAALELLGDAHAGAEDTARAVEAWTRAAHAAIAAGDATRVATLRSRIAGIDAAAAAALPAPVAAPRAAAAATILFEATAPAEADADAAVIDAAAGDSESVDEIEIDIDAAEFGDAAEESAAGEGETLGSDVEELVVAPLSDVASAEPDAESHAESSQVEIEIDAAADEPVALESASFELAQPAGETLPLEEPEIPDHFEIAAGASEAEAEPFEEPAPVALQEEPEPEPELEEVAERELEPEAPLALELQPQAEASPAPQTEDRAASVSAAESASGEFSSTTSAEITEELEEAAFYFEQGLLDEAESIYLRVVQRAPNHPAALLRLGEIAVARGQDSAGPVADVARAEEELAAANPSAAEAVQDIEPPDDLDLTAREFGPANMWQDEESDDGDGAEAVADAPPCVVQPDDVQPDDVQPDVVQLDDVTGDGVATEAESPALEATLPAPPETAPPLVQSVEAPTPEAEPTPERVTASQPEALSEHELTAPDVSIAEDAGAPAFDLAAELSEALVDGAPATRAGASTDQDGFSSLFSEFKRGVSRTLGEGDVETHFDLGIAYREMGLLDDAIGEFHYALGSTARRLDALHMMGLCALDVGRAIDAIGHLEQALASPDVPAERETALRFDLGRAHEAQGDCERALDAFRRVAELDAEFQDVGARIEALLSGLAAAHDDAAEVSAEGEAYESFDDLVAEAAEEAPAVAPEATAVTESYENFEEFLSDDAEDSAEEAGDADASDANAVRDHVEPVVAAPEVAVTIESPQPPDAEPEPPVGAPRRRKVSFF
jgi:tetratricopeptide (TPR) repeat protein